VATRGSPEQCQSFASGFKREGLTRSKGERRGFLYHEKAENSGEQRRTAENSGEQRRTALLVVGK